VARGEKSHGIEQDRGDGEGRGRGLGSRLATWKVPHAVSDVPVPLNPTLLRGTMPNIPCRDQLGEARHYDLLDGNLKPCTNGTIDLSVLSILTIPS